MNQIKKENSKRYNGIDIIKIMAIIFVPLLHYYLNFSFNEVKITGVINIFEIGIRWLSFSCIGLFVMSSGFLLSKKKLTKDYYLKSIKFWVIYFIFVVITTICNTKFDGEIFIQILRNFFSFPAYFWYVAFYLGLYYLVPFLNILINNLTKKQYLIFLLILIILICVPDFYNGTPGYKTEKIFLFINPFSSLFPFVYYFIGAYFKKYQPTFSKRKTMLILILTISFIAILNFTYSYGKSALFYGGGYGNVISVIITVSLFNIFYNIKIKNKSIANALSFVASITFEIYLALQLSDRLMIFTLSKIGILNSISFKYVLLTTGLNFIYAFIIGVFVHIFINIMNKVFLK